MTKFLPGGPMRTLNPLLARRAQVAPSPMALTILATFVVGVAIRVSTRGVLEHSRRDIEGSYNPLVS
jgi:hypothetical protein